MEIAVHALEKVSETAAEAVRENVVAMAQELKRELSETLPMSAGGMEGMEINVDAVKGSPLLDQLIRKNENLHHVESWINEINPDFDPFDVESPYCRNCGSCAYAVYRRLEGDCGAVATAENIPKNWQMEALTGMRQTQMSPEAIERTLLEQGSGAHAIIGIDRAYGPGHWFNAANIDGKVYAIDGQTGTIVGWPPTDLGNVVNWEMSMKV